MRSFVVEWARRMVVIALVLGTTGGRLGGQTFKLPTLPPAPTVTPVPEGWRPYTPTRIDWMCLELNSLMHRHLDLNPAMERYSFGVLFYLPKEPNTVVLQVTYFPGADRAALGRLVEATKEQVGAYAASHRCAWLKVVAEVKMLEAAAPK